MQNRMNMKTKGYLIIAALLTILSVSGCDELMDEINEADGNHTFERSITLDWYGADTTITVNEYQSEIAEYINETYWLVCEITENNDDTNLVKLSCLQNTTGQTRYAEIIVISKDGDKLTIKVTQETGIAVHDDVTDQRAYAPSR